MTTAEVKPTFAWYAIRAPVAIPLTDAIRAGARLRQALMSNSRVEGRHALSVFSGKDPEGQPLKENSHSFFLPADEDGDGQLDHALVWAPMGFDIEAQGALRRVSRLWGTDGMDADIELLGVTDRDAYSRFVDSGRPCLAQLGPSRVWESRTPFIMSRHPKKRNGRVVDGAEEQLLRGLETLGLEAPDSIEPLSRTYAGASWDQFELARPDGGGSRGSGRGMGFRLQFANPVSGPIALGYGARQGLGQFVAVR
jgi:CRISPR-associated protein Csb2